MVILLFQFNIRFCQNERLGSPLIAILYTFFTNFLIFLLKLKCYLIIIQILYLNLNSCMTNSHSVMTNKFPASAPAKRDFNVL